MKKGTWILIGIIILVALLMIGFFVLENSKQNVNETNIASVNLTTQDSDVLILNQDYCNPQSQCTPYGPNCRNWHATNYAPYKYCLGAIANIVNKNNVALCDKINYTELRVYCISLVTKDDASRSICLKSAGKDRLLKALCHITSFDEELQSYDRIGSFYNSSVSPFYFVNSNCSMDSCFQLVWKESDSCENNQPCESGFACNILLGKCQPLREGNINDICLNDSDCTSGLICNLGFNVCRYKGELNSQCKNDSDCVEELLCNALSNKCENIKSLNGYCGRNSECSPGLICNSFSKACMYLGENGTRCGATSECSPGLICNTDYGYKCDYPGTLAKGATCVLNFSCTSNYCNNRICA